MEILMLLAAFLLPWMTTLLAMRAMESRLSIDAHPLRQLGSSFFVGLLALNGIIYLDSKITGSVHSAVILLLLAALLVLQLMLARPWKGYGRVRTSPADNPDPSRATWANPLALCLLALIGGHLLLSAIEITYRPIFPWDAWQSWMYRAKAWFYAGHLIEFASDREWFNTGKITLNIAGNGYPIFTSTMAFWAARVMGEWSETLVNLPVLLAGFALAFALYGHCRESGASLIASLAAVFLLVSVPLLDTHLSLAGQADIWMVAFSGLGLVSVLRGINESNSYHTLFGLGLCAASILVKQEGIVWLLTGCAVCAITYRPRTALLLAFLAAGLTLVLLTQFTQIDPDSGQQILQLPVIGSIAINHFYILDDYLDYLFLKGSWNILWYLVAGSACVLLLKGRRTLRLSVLGFYAVVLCSQAVIFGFTEHGRWAEDGTAINRLLLHLLPAWIFSLLLAARAWQDHSRGQSTRQWKLVLPAAGAGLLALITGSSALLILPSLDSEPRVFNATSRLFAVTGAAIGGAEPRVTGYQDGISILSSGRTYIDAQSMPMLSVELKGSMNRAAGFFWRGQDSSDEVESMTIGLSGRHHFDLSQIKGWQGKITEIGLVLYGDKDSEQVTISNLQLASSTPANHLENIWTDWSSTEHWSQASVNWLAGGRPNQTVPLAAVLGSWLALSLLFLYLLPGDRRAKPAAAITLAVLAWLLTDSRWLLNSIAQANATVAYYRNSENREHIDEELDARLVGITADIVSRLPQAPVPLIVTGADPAQRFEVLRTKYRLLPNPVAAYIGRIVGIPATNAEALIMFDANKLLTHKQLISGRRERNAVSRILGRKEVTKVALPEDAGYLWQKLAP